MPRRKPVSSKQRKAELQLKRAIKRGDIAAPPPKPRARRGKAGPSHNLMSGSGMIKSSDPSKRLQSTFIKAEKEYLEKSRLAASKEFLQRPLPMNANILDCRAVGLHDENARQVTCPQRPKWRYDMAKKEVEKNEEAMFQKWLNDVDDHVEAWRGVRAQDTKTSNGDKYMMSGVQSSPTYFERNLEVWRQLWRVSEISQILLLLLDSRCPAIHFPPSLQAYCASLRPARPLIFVLTKTDLVPASYTSAWSTWLKTRYPSARVIKVDSYRRQEDNERKGQGQRKRFDPEIKEKDLEELVEALKAAHLELLRPPERIRDDAEKLQKWKPNVRQSIDWETAKRGGHADVDQPAEDTGEKYITIGLLGQPNVGKSSLLNAIFGAHKVKASRTPGKTKHFQTLFWTPEIRLVDCPGLVMPNFVPMELQVLCGILPISQIPSIPACMHYSLCLLPLERILNLTHPGTSNISKDSRNTRDEREAQRHRDAWTTMDVLTAYTINKGWVTAKAGRPDTNRAGNALLRALAEGKIRWAFWPPDVPPPENGAVICRNNGIYLGGAVEEDAHKEEESSDGDYEEQGTDEDTPSDQEESSDEEELRSEDESGLMGAGRFAALTLEQDVEENEESGD